MISRISPRLAGLMVAALVLALGIGCGKSSSDTQIVEATQSKMDAVAPGLSKHVQIQVASGVVVLSGSVSTEADRAAAEDAAHQAPGVKAVVNNLTIAGDPAFATAAGAQDQAMAAQGAPQPAASATGAGPDVHADGAVVPASQTAVLPSKPSPDRAKVSRRSRSGDAAMIAPDHVSGAGATTVKTPVVETASLTSSVQPAAPHRSVREVTVPPTTSIFVRLEEPLDSSQNEAGQTFQASTARPIVINNEVVVPQDADVRGHIVEAKKGKRLIGKSDLVLELTSVSWAGRTYVLQTDQWSKAKGGGRSTATKTGIGAGAGAGIGLAAGGAVGSAIGAGAGAGGGLVWSAVTGGRVKLPAETQIEFHLTSPVAVAPPVPGSSMRRPALATLEKQKEKEAKKQTVASGEKAN